MPSTFLGLNTAYLGLTASNAALNTTANNIANVNTEGYSRQRVNQQAANAMRVYTSYGCIGAGVDTTSIERQRDAFYDFKYWNNNADVGEYDVLQDYMKQIEDHFKDDTTMKGFNTVYDELFNSLQEVMKNAGDQATRSQCIGYAENLAYYFNMMSSTLESMQLDANAEIGNTVSQINTFASEIASLSQQINVIELEGGFANELRDRRDLIVDKLSKLVDVKVDESPIYDANDPTRETGATRYQVLIASSQKLVDADKFFQLECIPRDQKEALNQSDAVGLYDIVWTDGRNFNMYNPVMGGTLRGLIEIRDGNNQENFQGLVESVGANAGGDRTITIKATYDYTQDINKCTLPFDGVLRADGKLYHYKEFQANYDADGNVESYTFTVDPSYAAEDATADPTVGNKASVGSPVAYQGIPYYQEQMNEWCRNFAEAFNKILTQDGAVDDYGKAPFALFVANHNTDSKQQNIFDASEAEMQADVNKSYYYMTAKNFTVNKDIKTDSRLLATHTSNHATVDTKGESAYDVIEDIIDMRTNKSIMSFRGCNSSEFLQCVLSDIALNTSNALTFGQTFANIGKAIDNQRISISGVDEDEEALDLVSFQHSYNLASKMIQTLKEVYDRLILNTGV